MRKNERIRRMNDYGYTTLARLYNSDTMQALISWSEAQIAARAGAYNIHNVILTEFTECLDLRSITFKTKKAKNDFFKAFLQLSGWW